MKSNAELIEIWSRANRMVNGIVERDKRIAYLEKALVTVRGILAVPRVSYVVGISDAFTVIDKALKGKEKNDG